MVKRMRLTLRGLWRLKPFDESEDAAIAEGVYARSALLSVAVVSSGFLAVASLALLIAGHPAAVRTLAVAVGASALTAGLEWHVGLRARALNQLFVALIVAIGFYLLSD